MSIALLCLTMSHVGVARAEADGPDFLRVSGIAAGSTVNVRGGPGTGHPVIGSLPSTADHLRNLGCQGGLSFAQWQAASEAERAAAAQRRWCKIQSGRLVGWVSGLYLAEGKSP